MRDVFMANIFFAPMIETTKSTIENASSGFRPPRIHIVPMTIDKWMIEAEEQDWEKYGKFMSDLLGSLSKNNTNLEKDITRIIELEKELVLNYNKTSYASDDEWEMVGFDVLNKLVPTVEWRDFIEKSLAANKEFKIKKWTKFAIPSYEIMNHTGKWIKKMEINRRDQANLIIWRMIVTFARKFMHTTENGFGNIFKKTKSEKISRSENCLTQIKTFFYGIKDELVIAEYMDTKTKTYIINLWKNLKEEFQKVIRESMWMTKRTRLRAEEKLENTKFHIGKTMPITKEFRKLKTAMTLNYIENILLIGNYQWNTLAQSLGKELKFHKITEGLTEDTINAYYHREYNELTVLTGQIPDFLELGLTQSLPLSIMYGGFVGSLLGHELTHGFDSMGRKYDKDGFLQDWWEPEDIAAFNKSTKCMVSSYVFLCKYSISLSRWINISSLQ